MPLPLTTVVLLELALAATLGVLLLARPAPTAAPAARPTELGTTATTTAGAAGEAEAAGAAANPPAPLASRYSVPLGTAQADAADPLGVVLTGTVRWRDGTPVGRATIAADGRDARRDGAADANGRFALVGLAPGPWRLTVDAAEATGVTVPFVATDAPVQTLDVVLDRGVAVRVLARTLDGGAAAAAVQAALGADARLHAMAQRGPFAEQLAATEVDPVAGEAKWTAAPGASSPSLGTLHLPPAGPAHVALLLRHVVLAQQVLQPDQREVTFVVDPEALRALGGAVRVRVLAATTGEPVPGARLSAVERPARAARTGNQGEATLTRLPPGPLRCEVHVSGFETCELLVDVEPGRTVDLGELRLEAPLPLHGRLVDEQGNATHAQIAWTPLKWRTAPGAFAATRTTRCDADGRFVLAQAGRGRVLVTARRQDGRVAAAVFVNPPTEPVELRLVGGCALVVVGPADLRRAPTLTVLDAANDPVAAWALSGRQPLRTTLPPGPYRYEVHDGGPRVVQHGTFELGPVTTTLEVR